MRQGKRCYNLLEFAFKEAVLTDPRVEKFARVLVEHSTRVQPGDRVLIEATTAAEPLVRALFKQILEKGGHPHPLLAFPEQGALYLTYASETQLDFVPTFQQLAYEQFESRIRIHSVTNTRALTRIPPARLQRRAKATSVITETQMRRGAEGKFKWVTTIFPTQAYAQDAEMSLEEYADFIFRACHVHEDDPVAYWQSVG